MRHLLIITGFLSIFACSAHTNPQKWERAEIVGYNFRLVSKTAIQSYSFTELGDVIATLGTVGGPVTGPVFFWEIDNNGILIIKENMNKDAKIRMEMRKISQTNNYYKISTASGHELTFQRTKWK